MDLCQNWRDDGVAFDGTAAAAALKAETRRAERITSELECGTAVALPWAFVAHWPWHEARCGLDSILALAPRGEPGEA
jgi:hypothetical protein